MNTANNHNNEASDICANCGKGEESSNGLKACTACKLVKYCNRDCQIAHRPQHKKACKKRAAELHDEKLFKQPPPEYGDCPICMQTLPLLTSGSRYKLCCGKTICSGCIYANKKMQLNNKKHLDLCPFCRIPTPQGMNATFEDTKKQADAGHAAAINMMGGHYERGDYDLTQDHTKALEFYQQAGNLGYAPAYNNIGGCYDHGEGVERDEKKANHYYELAAMKGNVTARDNLGNIEGLAGNHNRALKHFMIAVKGGSNDSLEMIRKMVTFRLATKDDYTKALKSYQIYLDEIKSNQRDEAAAFDDQFKYIA